MGGGEAMESAGGTEKTGKEAPNEEFYVPERCDLVLLDDSELIYVLGWVDKARICFWTLPEKAMRTLPFAEHKFEAVIGASTRIQSMYYRQPLFDKRPM
jgi:hypothetical protein